MKINDIEQLKNIIEKSNEKFATIIGTNVLILENDESYLLSDELFKNLKNNSDFILDFDNMQTIIKLK